ncbi:MAG TPA: DUF4139 domain-containing protein [Tepidisphaeraceae bacterium]|jgi:hypothetical protein|nr:DUF4139 domain-containing protein [Tepidisphaeraceae bacterium]
MLHRVKLALFLLVFLTAVLVRADEIVAESPIQSVGLFKNGLAIVTRTLTVTKPGTYRFEDAPEPVHGTYWVSGAIPVVSTVTMREVQGPPRTDGQIDLQQELVGKNVTIHFNGQGIPPAQGRVVEIARAQGNAAWNRIYDGRDNSYFGGGPPPQQQRFLVLSTDKGRIYADVGMIAQMIVEGAGDVKRRVPVLLLTIDKAPKDPGVVTISYLTRGMAWAPTYLVRLNDSKTLTIEQQAVVKNELQDFKDAELKLISGFPSVQFAHVVSPLSLQTNWATFFQQLNMQVVAPGGLMGGSGGQAMRNSAAPDATVDFNATPEGDGIDLHYHSIGKRTMAEGDALSLSVATGQASYERIVEWIVPDSRDVEGRYYDENVRREDPEKFRDAAWDAIKFKNPLSFPMTTGPATVISDGRFAGQRMSYWTNVGEETTLQINKALSVRTRASEQEQQKEDRTISYIGGREYRKVPVKGELTVNNHRTEEIKLVIRRQFSGDFIEGDAHPTVALREEGVYSINRRNELTWTIPIKAGEEKKLNYSYTVLIPN